MSLGFNNYPVNWRQEGAGADVSGQILAQGITSLAQGVGGGIEKYQARQKEKKQLEDSVTLFKKLGRELGAPAEMLQDDAAIKAGIKDMGVGNFLKTVNGIQGAKQQDAALRQEQARLADAIGTYAERIKGGSAEKALPVAIDRYVNSGGMQVKELTSVLTSVQGEIDKEQARKDAAPLQKARLEQTIQSTEESKARTQRMQAVEEQIPLGAATPIEGLEGYTAVRTGPNSIQVVPPGGGDFTQEDRLRLQVSVMRGPIQKYLEESRNDDGTPKKTLITRKFKINPAYEAVLAEIGIPSFVIGPDGKPVLMQPTAPQAPQAPQGQPAPQGPAAPFPDIFEGLQ